MGSFTGYIRVILRKPSRGTTLTLWVQLRRTPPPSNRGIIGIYGDPNIICIIPYSHYYWVEGPPKV